MRRSDPEARIHLIAHSHGGNVVLRAIELYFYRLEEQAWDIVNRAERKVRDTAPIAAIYEALREVCGEELAKSQDFHQLTAGLILPLLQKETDERPRREEFYAAWSRSPQSHRLGRLIFMGTPFYYKRWLPGSRLGRGARFLIILLFWGTYVWLVFYAIIYAVIGIFARILSLVLLSLFPSIDFVDSLMGWTAWLLAIFVTGVAFVVKGIEETEEQFWDVNVYYQRRSYYRRWTPGTKVQEWTLDNNVQQAPPLDGLVLSSGLLDEALMGLLIDPLVYGFLTPELKASLTPPYFPSAPLARSGERVTVITIIKRFVWLVSTPVRAFFVRASRWWTQPRVTELILESASAAGFGLPIHEFSNAVVTPKKELDVPGVFEAGEVVDVTKLFAKTRLTRPSPATPAQFDFLWDQTALEERIKKSFTWKKLEPHLEELRARKGRGDNQSEFEQFKFEVKRLCAIIDVRVREFAGMVELFHSEYYAHDKIIEAIARFLETGARPGSIP